MLRPEGAKPPPPPSQGRVEEIIIWQQPAPLGKVEPGPWVMAAVFQGEFGMVEKGKGYKDRGGPQQVSL